MKHISLSLGILIILIMACNQQPVVSDQPSTDTNQPEKNIQAYSLDSTPLYTIPDSEATRIKKDSLLQIARDNYLHIPVQLDNIIWYGRRLAYQSRFMEAIEIYTLGLIPFPEAPELFRHRGHRYISTRQFDKAISDFEKAVTYSEGRDIEIEPDGLPNKLNIPLSSLQFNIWYHLALAHYLKGDFESAANAWEACMEVSTNPDLLCATTDWLYMTYRRLGKEKEATKLLETITPEMEIIENTSYHNRLLMYKGLKQPEDLLDFENTDDEARIDIVTQGYGVGNWYLYNGEEEKAFTLFNQLLESDYWSAFGYIAAEAEVFRR
ncbi:MAG: hypothetical protein AAF502_09780 [Bacteroidota bacterium]